MPFVNLFFFCTTNDIEAASAPKKSINLKINTSAKDFEENVDWPVANTPGKAFTLTDSIGFELKNKLIHARWNIKKNQLQFVYFYDGINKKETSFENISPFTREAKLLAKVDLKDFVITKKPQLFSLAVDPKGVRIADHIPGKSIRLSMLHPATGICIDWEAELRDGSNYIRLTYVVSHPNAAKPEIVTRVVGMRLPTEYICSNSIGNVPGSPYSIPETSIVAGIEQPGYLAIADSLNVHVTELSMPTQLTLGADDQYRISAMIGCFSVEQRRRSFLYYLEREKVSRSRTYLHYNVWYDIEELSEKKLTKVAHSYNDELVLKCGVKLDGFVLDDGWDDPKTNLWIPDKTRFTDGFSGLQKLLAATSGAKLGLWISPCGGYGGQKQRLDLAKKAGALPEEATSFDLGYPGYFQLYKDLCLNFMKKYDINYFKWDNAAPFENSGRTFGNLKSTSHFIRLCQLSAELHKENPNVFINATVGTWSSPFWLNHVDCTWRMGRADVYWIGKGDNRERGMNYRDGEVYTMVVKRAPLYPLNSMMFHGVVLSHCYQAKTTSEVGNNMANEFRSYFALGTNLQELYLSPDLMNTKAWDDLAECIQWNKKHARLLIDTHWVQGDPNIGEPYCYASWRKNEGVICFRNPDETPRDITFDIEKAFELPANAKRNYQLHAAYADQRIQIVNTKASIPVTITLKPLEVPVFETVAE